ncbi:hypothetical protein C9374_006639 [Naegleria lovaniensis]|uniref:Uncharacterized protein n=1 Tax=Naegleria lovaniensis TaxID=51637 RepID=A0AA88GHH4_NAELO|nr:uncharacterized protein C9374_006639 [Naegleria lovaniensis]KAG2379522.1 hypothetical protein C9374_006639 [Naegleria lovaniensis]
MPPKKWVKRSSKTSSSENPVQSSSYGIPTEKLDHSVISNIFSSVSKLNWDQFEQFCCEYGSEVVVAQKLFGMNLAHVLVNHGDEDLMSSDISRTDSTNFNNFNGDNNHDEIIVQNNIRTVNDFLCQLIKKGVDLNFEDSRNQLKPIHLCAKRCSKSYAWILTMIIEGRQIPTCMCGNGFTPLHYAISFNRLELVREMLEASSWSMDFGEFIPSRFISSFQKTREDALRSSQPQGHRVLFPIHIAAKEGHVEILKYLVVHGAATLQQNSQLLQSILECYGMQNLSLLESRDNREDSLTRFIVNMTTLDTFSMSPLMLSIKEGHISCVQLLLSLGANANQCDARGKSCLVYASENFLHKEAIKHMLGIDYAQNDLIYGESCKDDTHSFLMSCFLQPISLSSDISDTPAVEESTTNQEENFADTSLADNIEDNIYYI